MNRDILRITHPNITSKITVPLPCLVDLVQMNHPNPELYTDAIASAAMRNTFLAVIFIIFAPAFLILGSIWGNYTIGLAMVLFMMTSGIVQFIVFTRNLLILLPAALGIKPAVKWC